MRPILPVVGVVDSDSSFPDFWTRSALAVSHWIEHQTGWSIKKFVETARRYHTVQIRAGRQTLTAAVPVPDDLAQALTKICSPPGPTHRGPATPSAH